MKDQKHIIWNLNNVLFSIEAQYFPTHAGEES